MQNDGHTNDNSIKEYTVGCVTLAPPMVLRPVQERYHAKRHGRHETSLGWEDDTQNMRERMIAKRCTRAAPHRLQYVSRANAECFTHTLQLVSAPLGDDKCVRKYQRPGGAIPEAH